MGHEMAYTSLANMSHAPKKSWVRAMFDKISGTGGPLPMTTTHVKAGAHTVRQVGEGMIVGGILGAINAELKGGLEPHGVPLDALGAAALGVGAVVMAHEEFSPDMANGAAACATVFSYRKTDAFLSEKKAARVAGETDMGQETNGFDVGAEDPLMRLARHL
jgi:hypothetical protein